MKRTSYQLPADKISESAKLQNGEEMTRSMVGAFYGSSYEYNISLRLQLANGQDRYCPAHQELLTILKPKYQHGEFGAEILSENQEFPASKREIGRGVVELASIEEVRAVRATIDRLSVPSSLTKELVYQTSTGQTVRYEQVVREQIMHRDHNRQVQQEKDQYLLDQHLQAVWVGKRKESPAYPQYALDHIAELNRKVWTATGVNLVITFTGLHTIAKDSKFYGGRLSQAELDQLASLLDYKEVNSFFKGTVKAGVISIPIQSKHHLRKSIEWLQSTGALMIHEWPKEVQESALRLVKE